MQTILSTKSPTFSQVRVWFCNRRQREKKLAQGVGSSDEMNTGMFSEKDVSKCLNFKFCARKVLH